MTGDAPLEKPAKRGPKLRKPIKRSWIKRTAEALRRQAIEMVRRNPLKRKARIPRVSSSAARKAELAADANWRRAILAKGPCAMPKSVVVEFDDPENPHFMTVLFDHMKCVGPMDPAHGFPKGAYPAARHLVENGWPLCRAAHDFYGRNPRLWTAFMVDHLGEAGYEALKLKAQGRTTA